MGVSASALKRYGVNLLVASYRRLRHAVLIRKIRAAASASPLRLALGAAGIAPSGWLCTDKEHLNLVEEKDWCRYFCAGSIDAMVAEHVWEHLTGPEALLAARNCHRFLRAGGYLRVAVPDGNHPDSCYISAVKPHGSGSGANDHRVLYTNQTLSAVFEAAGFQVELLEYFDAAGSFHAKDWDSEACFIERSQRFDPRNKDGKLNYTSIILDAWKR